MTELLAATKATWLALPVMLNTDALLTHGNDFGMMPCPQVAGLGQAGDALVLFTTSGNRAIWWRQRAAKAQGFSPHC